MMRIFTAENPRAAVRSALFVFKKLFVLLKWIFAWTALLRMRYASMLPRCPGSTCAFLNLMQGLRRDYAEIFFAILAGKAKLLITISTSADDLYRLGWAEMHLSRPALRHSSACEQLLHLNGREAEPFQLSRQPHAARHSQAGMLDDFGMSRGMRGGLRRNWPQLRGFAVE